MKNILRQLWVFCFLIHTMIPAATKDKILGEWGIYETAATENLGGVLCNVCPTVTFTKDSMAIVEIGCVVQSLRWKINDSIIELKNISQNDSGEENILESDSYVLKYHNKNKYGELFLKHFNSKYGFLLRKHDKHSP